MKIHEVAEATFNKYAHDLLDRLEKSPPDFWAPVGDSGTQVAEALRKYISACNGTERWKWLKQLKVARLFLDVGADEYKFEIPGDADSVRSRRVLLIDSVVNSGSTLLASMRFLRKAEPADVTAYAIAVRICADAVPNYFSFPMAANDRVFLPWQETRTNNRMTNSGFFRSLQESDLGAPKVASGKPFIDRLTWEDRWYSLKKEEGRRVIVVETACKVVGFVSLVIDEARRELHIDELATDLSVQGKGYGGALLRYAETLARSSGCSIMNLWAHDDVVDMYSKYYFTPKAQQIKCGGDGNFHFMERVLGSSKAELQFWVDAKRDSPRTAKAEAAMSEPELDSAAGG